MALLDDAYMVFVSGISLSDIKLPDTVAEVGRYVELEFGANKATIWKRKTSVLPLHTSEFKWNRLEKQWWVSLGQI